MLTALFVVPACAHAETEPAATVAPVLQSPAAGAATFTEGGSMTFEWRGSLQGDSDAIGRSYFRVEVIKAADLPSGSQTAWPEAESFLQTEPGASETSGQMGVPNAGDYRWRVCAWGVVDDLVDNTIQQIPGGCSASRTFTTKAAAVQSTTIGEMKMETKTQVAGETKTIFVEKQPDPTTPAPTTTAPEPETKTVVEEIKDAVFQKVTSRDVKRTGSAISGLASGSGDAAADPLAADQAAQRDGIGGRVASGLTSTLPGVPIPFWTLALLLATFPIARAWRRSVLGMFDWADGSVDGAGTPADVLGDLPIVHDAHDLKIASKTADGGAPLHHVTTSDSAPDRGRHAA